MKNMININVRISMIKERQNIFNVRNDLTGGSQVLEIFSAVN